MSNARIDENTRQVGLGFVQGSRQTTMPFAINASNELLIEIIPRGTPMDPLVVTTHNIPIDENTRQVAAGLTNDANLNITPLTVDIIVGVLPCVRVELI